MYNIVDSFVPENVKVSGIIKRVYHASLLIVSLSHSLSLISAVKQFNQHQSIKSTLSFNMRHWSQAKLDPIADTANYTCTSTDNSVGEPVSSTTLFRVECKSRH